MGQTEEPPIKVVALAGGVGGARLADGLAQIMPPENLTIVVNTGDDFEHFGLYICPDLDTVCYTLAGLVNPVTGWGRSDETWRVLEAVNLFGGPTWFHLGDQDLGLHLERTRRRASGAPAVLAVEALAPPTVEHAEVDRAIEPGFLARGAAGFQRVLRRVQPHVDTGHHHPCHGRLPHGEAPHDHQAPARR